MQVVAVFVLLGSSWNLKRTFQTRDVENPLMGSFVKGCRRVWGWLSRWNGNGMASCWSHRILECSRGFCPCKLVC